MLALFLISAAFSLQAKESTLQESEKSATKAATQKPVTHLTLTGAHIYRRDCYNRHFIVLINNESYFVLYNSIAGDEAKSYQEKYPLCRRHVIGFQKGDPVDVEGILIKHDGQKALYNAKLIKSEQ
jgi:hypothetical protein